MICNTGTDTSGFQFHYQFFQRLLTDTPAEFLRQFAAVAYKNYAYLDAYREELVFDEKATHGRNLIKLLEVPVEHQEQSRHGDFEHDIGRRLDDAWTLESEGSQTLSHQQQQHHSLVASHQLSEATMYNLGTSNGLDLLGAGESHEDHGQCMTPSVMQEAGVQKDRAIPDHAVPFEPLALESRAHTSLPQTILVVNTPVDESEVIPDQELEQPGGASSTQLSALPYSQVPRIEHLTEGVSSLHQQQHHSSVGLDLTTGKVIESYTGIVEDNADSSKPIELPPLTSDSDSTLPQTEPVHSLTTLKERSLVEEEVGHMEGTPEAGTERTVVLRDAGPSKDVKKGHAHNSRYNLRRRWAKHVDFLHILPAELRNDIWKLSLAREAPLVLTKRPPGVIRLEQKPEVRHLTALLLVNRQTYEESKMFLYTENTLKFQDVSKDTPDRLKDEHRQLVTFLYALPRPIAQTQLHRISITVNLYRRPSSDEDFRRNLARTLGKLRDLRTSVPSLSQVKLECTIELGKITCRCGHHEQFSGRLVNIIVDVDISTQLRMLSSIERAVDELHHKCQQETAMPRRKVLHFSANRLKSLASEIKQIGERLSTLALGS